MQSLQRDEDERLLIEAAQRHPACFAELYEKNFDRIYAFVARRVRTREEAQDLTAEVFHQALASIRNFSFQGAPFASWLYGIAANLLRSHWQKIGRKPEAAETVLGDAEVEIERSLIVAQLLETLPPAQQRVLFLRFIRQKGIREIARELGRSEGAVKQLQLRALENLREKFGRKS